ncbi:uncharacterized protein LOC143560379 [Bidens hawaiensis]|uniref:uncharacterized protein LOC143560379 n=1 Tax=Bidens hawaiensis TaxID=980011 RepID=UPI00404A289F
MGETTKSATVNQKFLTSIVNEDDIRNMDWCGYVITCLKRTKEGWNGIKPYNGPLTFLVALYAHELQLKRSPKNAIAPAIRYITTGFLANLEVSMYDKVQEDNQLTQNVELQVMLETHIESAESQTAIDLNVNLLQDEVQFQSTNPDSVLSLKLFIGPPSARSLS